MKIKAFTPEESDSLIELISRRDALVKECNELGITLVLKAYEVYLDDFKYSWSSPFTFKPISKDKFIIGMLGGGGVYTKTSGRFVDSTGGQPVEYLYGFKSECTYEFKKKSDNSALWIIDAGSTIVIRDSHDDDKFINMLLDYAQRPFEFNETDIERITRWKTEVPALEDLLEYLKNELQAK